MIIEKKVHHDNSKVTLVSYVEKHFATSNSSIQIYTPSQTLTLSGWTVDRLQFLIGSLDSDREAIVCFNHVTIVVQQKCITEIFDKDNCVIIEYLPLSIFTEMIDEIK